MSSSFNGDNEMTSSLTASFFMASALCFHFFGYEMARAASIALLAAKDIGLGNGALSFTVAVGSPISAMVLFLYARSIKRNGPRITLLVSNICCLILLGLMSVACGSLKGFWGQSSVLLFFCFREIYVSLLSTQQWSFIASVLDSKTSNYLVTFAGVVSVASAIGGCSVEYLVSLGGVRALLITAFVSCGFSFISAEIGTYLARTEEGKSRVHSGLSKFSTQGTKDIISGTSSGDTLKDKSIKQDDDTLIHNDNKVTGDKKEVSKGFWRKSLKLLMKHETLQLLFIEALIHQCCSNMLNMMFYDGLRTGIPLDSERAVLVGRFFASVNIAACFLQVFVMPHVLCISTLPRVLRSIPMIILGIVLLGYIYPSLLTIMFGFGALKVLEYSIMTSATEMIYMPMSGEQRYLGKELIRFFGHRMGKSAAVMILSAASVHFKPSLATQSLWGAGITAMWCVIMLILSNHLALRNKPELIVKEVAMVSKTIETNSNGKNSSMEVLKVTEVQRKDQDLSVDCTQRTGSHDTDTTSESGSGPISTDSLNTYYMPTEEGERDFSTQDQEGKTLTITPSFHLLASLDDSLTTQLRGDEISINKNTPANTNIATRISDIHEVTSAVGRDDEDWSDFIVLDNIDDTRYDEDGDDERKINDTFLLGPHEERVINEIEEAHLDDEGLRRRSPRKIEKKLKKSPLKMRRDKEKKSSENLNEMNTAVKTALSHRDLLSTLLRVNSTKFSGKKASNTWMSKINGTENGRPLMFRVGSTCMTMSNLVNENRDIGSGSSKNDRDK